MLEYNCRKNFYNAPLDTKKHRKTTPYLRPKKVGTYSPSKAVARNLGEEVPRDLPYHDKTRKKTEVTSKTDRCRMAKIAHEKLKWPARSHDRTRTSLSCHQNVNFGLIHSQVIQSSEITFSMTKLTMFEISFSNEVLCCLFEKKVKRVSSIPSLNRMNFLDNHEWNLSKLPQQIRYYFVLFKPRNFGDFIGSYCRYFRVIVVQKKLDGITRLPFMHNNTEHNYVFAFV